MKKFFSILLTIIIFLQSQAFCNPLGFFIPIPLAEKALKISADEINNLAESKINLEAERGIVTTKNTYNPKISYEGGYGILWDESAEIVCSAPY